MAEITEQAKHEAQKVVDSIRKHGVRLRELGFEHVLICVVRGEKEDITGVSIHSPSPTHAFLLLQKGIKSALGNQQN